MPPEVVGAAVASLDAEGGDPLEEYEPEELEEPEEVDVAVPVGAEPEPWPPTVDAVGLGVGVSE